MKKTLKLILLAALILNLLLGCSQPQSDSSPLDNNIYTLLDGQSVNRKFRDLGGEEAIAFLPSKTAPSKDDKIEYIDSEKKRIAVWVDKNNKILDLEAKNVAAENAEEKVY